MFQRLEQLFSGLSLLGGRSEELRTSNVSLVSHAHGRQRREERGIDRRELQVGVWCLHLRWSACVQKGGRSEGGRSEIF